MLEQKESNWNIFAIIFIRTKKEIIKRKKSENIPKIFIEHLNEMSF